MEPYTAGQETVPVIDHESVPDAIPAVPEALLFPWGVVNLPPKIDQAAPATGCAANSAAPVAAPFTHPTALIPAAAIDPASPLKIPSGE